MKGGIGFFGNIWIRQHTLKKGQRMGGHLHHFDHVTMLAQGAVEVTVDGSPPKVFIGPTFIVIKKEHKHAFKALTGNVSYFCVFALRDIDGEVTDIFSGDNSPYGSADAGWDKAEAFDATTTVPIN